MPESFSHNTHSFNTTIRLSNHFTVADDRSNILTWLSPLDPKPRHQDIKDRRVENAGEWLLQTEEFRSWSAGGGEEGEFDEVVLFSYGDPGVGNRKGGIVRISSSFYPTVTPTPGGNDASLASQAKEKKGNIQKEKNGIGRCLKLCGCFAESLTS